MFHLPGESNGCNTKRSERRCGGAETRTTESAAAVHHPFPFHGLDLCTFVRRRENRWQQFLSNFFRSRSTVKGGGTMPGICAEAVWRQTVGLRKLNRAKSRHFLGLFMSRRASHSGSSFAELQQQSQSNFWTVGPIGRNRAAFPATSDAISFGDGTHVERPPDCRSRNRMRHHRKSSASSAPARRAWRSPRTSCTPALRSIASNARTTSAATGTSAARPAASTARRG